MTISFPLHTFFITLMRDWSKNINITYIINRNELYFAVKWTMDNLLRVENFRNSWKRKRKSINTCQVTIRLHAGRWLKLTFNENLPYASDICQIKKLREKLFQFIQCQWQLPQTPAVDPIYLVLQFMLPPTE